jgi:hypothetical protein
MASLLILARLINHLLLVTNKTTSSYVRILMQDKNRSHSEHRLVAVQHLHEYSSKGFHT